MNMEDDKEVSSFKELGVCEQLLEACDNLGWKTPSKIQALLLPHAFQAYIFTPDAMETGVFIWTWLVSSAPQLGPLVLSELVDAWLWTIDTKRGLFASEVKYFGPTAKLRPHVAPGEPETQPEKNPIDQIIAHRLWLSFLIDRFEVRKLLSNDWVIIRCSPLLNGEL